VTHMRSPLPRHLLLLLLALLLAPQTWAQEGRGKHFGIRKVERLHLDDVHAGRDQEHFVELYLRALTASGQPAELLPPWPLEIREDDERIDPSKIEVTPLEETGQGVACVLAIDVSPTMERPFEQAKKAALRFLDRLQPTDHLAVVSFAGEPEVVAPFTASLSAKRAQINALQVDSESLSTRLFDGVYLALQQIRDTPDLPRRSFVIVFSDGGDSGSVHGFDAAVDLSKGDESEPRILVFAIGYRQFGGRGLDVLERLAEQSGAEFLRASSTILLQGFYEDIWHQMMQSYVVRFPSKMDGESHNVQVEISGQVEGRTARYPDYPTLIWPYLLTIGLLGLLIAGVLHGLQRRSAGQLVAMEPGQSHRSFPLQKGPNRVGALPDNDIVISASAISRNHAVIHVNGSRVEVEDLGSTNGTFINDKPVRTSPLRPSDRIRFGDVELIYTR